MFTFSVFKDFDTPNRAGAAGLYQIIEIHDFNENDITKQFNQGTFYTDELLRKEISKRFNLQLDLIEILEAN